MAHVYDYSKRRSDLFSPAMGKSPEDFFLDWRAPKDNRNELLLCAELARLAYARQDVVSRALPRAGLMLANRGWMGGESLGTRWRSQGTDGFVADGAEDLWVVVFRGTESDKPEDILADLRIRPRPCPFAGGRVHGGFLEAYQAVQAQLRTLLADRPAPGSLLFTGHSLGAAVATLAAAEYRDRKPRLVIYGSPRVGDASFAAELAGLAIQRVVHCADVVTRIPPAEFTKEGVADILMGFLRSVAVRDSLAEALARAVRLFLGEPGFVHVGELRYIDRTNVLLTTAPSDESMEADRAAAREAYGIPEGAAQPGLSLPSSVDGLVGLIESMVGRISANAELVPWRDLADHAPINYVGALAAVAQG